MKSTKPMIIGHRGLTGTDVADNSEKAIRQAKEAGFDGVEIDVQLTKDQECILWHDELFCGELVCDKYFRDCQESCNYPLLTLKEALYLVKTLGLYLMCEIKVYAEHIKLDLANKAIELLQQSNLMPSDYCITSFDKDVLVYLYRKDPSIDYTFAFEKPVTDLPSIPLKAIVFPDGFKHTCGDDLPVITYKHRHRPDVLAQDHFAYVVDKP